MEIRTLKTLASARGRPILLGSSPELLKAILRKRQGDVRTLLEGLDACPEREFDAEALCADLVGQFSGEYSSVCLPEVEEVRTSSMMRWRLPDESERIEVTIGKADDLGKVRGGKDANDIVRHLQETAGQLFDDRRFRNDQEVEDVLNFWYGYHAIAAEPITTVFRVEADENFYKEVNAVKV